MPKSLLFEPTRHPMSLSETVLDLGKAVVVAPHPDDESLGCGGVLALLARAGQSPHVIVMTDGSRSHPNSVSYPPSRLGLLRETETLAALHALGLAETAVTFQRFGDCELPTEQDGDFAAAVSRLRLVIASLSPDTIFVPWRRDPHRDHVATWQIMRKAVSERTKRCRWFEYPIWAWTNDESGPRAEEAVVWRLNIAPVISRKLDAISQHASQLGNVVKDDPHGFVLTTDMLAHFAHPWELFIYPHDE